MLDKYVVYLDESGDLGWKFDKPFQKVVPQGFSQSLV